MSAKRGFTLLELLVAAAITAGLSVILASTLSSILRNHSDQNRMVSYGASMQSAITIINDMISTAQYIEVTQMGTNSSLVIAQQPVLATKSQEHDVICLDTDHANINVFAIQVPYAKGDPNVHGGNLKIKDLRSIKDCNATTLTSHSLVEQRPLFNGTLANIIEFNAWPIWSVQGKDGYSQSEPPAVRYQIIGSYNSVSPRASQSVQFPFVYESSALTLADTAGRGVGP